MGQRSAKEVRGKPVVVVVGAGYAGAKIAKELDKNAQFNVVVIDRKDHHMHNIASARALSQAGFESEILIPYEALLKYGSVVHAEVTSVDEHKIMLNGYEEPVKFDYLIICTGSSYPFPGKLQKTRLSDAVGVFKEAQSHLVGATNVCIIGGGPVGVELAGEIATDYPDKKVTIISSSAQLCQGPGLTEKFSAKIAKQLVALHVDLILGDKAIMEENKMENLRRLKDAAAARDDFDKAKEYKAQMEQLDGQELVSFAMRDDVPITYDTNKRVVKTVKGREVTADLTYFCSGLTLNNHALTRFRAPEFMDKGRLRVDDNLRVLGFKNVWALGDISNREAAMGYLAQRQADYVADYFHKVILKGAASFPAYVNAPPGALVSVGRNHGVAQIMGGVYGSTFTKFIKSKDMMVDSNWNAMNMDRKTKKPARTVPEAQSLTSLAHAMNVSEEQARRVKAGLPAFDLDGFDRQETQRKRQETREMKESQEPTGQAQTAGA